MLANKVWARFIFACFIFLARKRPRRRRAVVESEDRIMIFDELVVAVSVVGRGVRDDAGVRVVAAAVGADVGVV